jgi:hypothetical protein
MSNEYITIVNARSGFWKDRLKEQIIKATPSWIDSINNDEITIITRNNNAIDDIIELSKKFPHEDFQVKIATEDVYENHVFLYQIANGISRHIKDGLEYCIGINVADSKRLSPDLLKKFEKRAIEFFQKLDQIGTNRVEVEISFDKDPFDAKIDKFDTNAIIEYQDKDVRLTATKQGLTYIQIRADFIEEKKAEQIPIEGKSENYNDLPF